MTWLWQLQKQIHAMDFLFKVRTQYSKTPAVYNSFLEIMKEFKSAAWVDCTYVIRVFNEFRTENV